MKWFRPAQLPTAPETVFLRELEDKHHERFFGQARGSTTPLDAWNGLSLEERRHYMARAKKNELHNMAKATEFKTRCLLSPALLSPPEMSPESARFWEMCQESWLRPGPRRLALQRWERYRSDQPSGDCETPVPAAPFRIMDLPFELRREIFSLVLSRSYPVRQFPPDRSADAVQGPVDVRIFAVSRLVFAEAVKVFYEVNTFTINTTLGRYYREVPLFIRQSTGSQAPRASDLIKRVYVSFSMGHFPHMERDRFLFIWKIFCEFLRMCKSLRKVEVTVQWAHGNSDMTNLAIDRMIDISAELSMNIRSTNEAVFSDVMTWQKFERRDWRERRITYLIAQGGGELKE